LSDPEPIYLSEIYLHRPLRQTLDLSGFPEAGDVNAEDEVPRSAWFSAEVVDVGSMARGPEGFGPPRAPFRVLADEPVAVAGTGFCILDARGQRYELAIDPNDRPEMSTGALAIAARLVWAIGLKTSPVFVTQVALGDFSPGDSGKDVAALLRAGAAPVAGHYRVAALSLPSGVDLGRTPESGVRGDDPNDLVAHETRRTLRTLRVFASWLALQGLGPAKTVDRYVGKPGDGHVEHQIVGLDQALGAADVVRSSDPLPAEGGGPPWKRLITLGLAPNPPPAPTQVAIPALGQFDGDVDPATFAPPLPYEPADQLQPADGYWAAKRIAAVARAEVALAVDVARFSDARAARAVEQVLNERAKKVVSYWFQRVTPLEVVGFAGGKLTLRDEAVARGIVQRAATSYRFDFLSGAGARAADSATLRPEGAELELVLSEGAALAARDYLVIEVSASRAGKRLPRPMQVHISLVAGRPRVVGIRH
jgi:hypothetical protein